MLDIIILIFIWYGMGSYIIESLKKIDKKRYKKESLLFRISMWIYSPILIWDTLEMNIKNRSRK